MTEEEAQRIVYEFVDVVCQGAAIVCDIDRLRKPKEVIAQAFEIHIQGYEKMQAISQETFVRMGYDKDLSDLKAMRMRLEDFKEIAAEDKAAIAGLMIEKHPSDDTMDILAKYLTQ